MKVSLGCVRTPFFVVSRQDLGSWRRRGHDRRIRRRCAEASWERDDRNGRRRGDVAAEDLARFDVGVLGRMMPQPVSMEPTDLLSLQRQLSVPREVAVVGCGRWGKILCQALAEFSPPLQKIHLVAERNAAEVIAWVDEKRTQSRSLGFERVYVTQDLQEVLRDERIEAGF